MATAVEAQEVVSEAQCLLCLIPAGYVPYAILEAVRNIATGDAPVIDGSGRILLQADDDTWHYVYLASDEGVRIEVEQTPTADPGTRGYFIWTANDATKHRTDLGLDEGFYRLNINQSASGAASDYTTLALAISPGFTVFHNVTLTLDETYTDDVNQTPNP